MTEGVPISFEDYFPHLDKHFRFTSVPFGEYFITTGADITAIKKAELALRESEARLREANAELEQRVAQEQAAAAALHEARRAAMNLMKDAVASRQRAEQAGQELHLIVDSSPAMIFYKDRENRFLRVNRAFADSMGTTKEQLEGRSLFDVFPREQAEAFWRDDLEVLATGRPKLGVVEPMRTASGERWLQTDKVASRDAQGNLTGIIGFAVDITERQAADREREIAVKFLGLVNTNTGLPDLIEAATGFFHEKSGCEAVGIRLKRRRRLSVLRDARFPGGVRAGGELALLPATPTASFSATPPATRSSSACAAT